jgi:hypothetical protein
MRCLVFAFQQLMLLYYPALSEVSLKSYRTGSVAALAPQNSRDLPVQSKVGRWRQACEAARQGLLYLETLKQGCENPPPPLVPASGYWQALERTDLRWDARLRH